MDQREVALSFDGSIPVNPGPECHWGWVLVRGTALVDKSSGGHRAERMTVNEAEYAAILNGLETYLIEYARQGDLLTVLGDSQLVIFQIGGKYSVSAPHLRPLYDHAVDLLKMIRIVIGSPVNLEWVPRYLNREADTLSRPDWVLPDGHRAGHG